MIAAIYARKSAEQAASEERENRAAQGSEVSRCISVHG
jgi:hypothetical protein